MCDPIYGPMLSQTRDDYPGFIRRGHNEFQGWRYKYKYHEVTCYEMSSEDGDINLKFL